LGRALARTGLRGRDKKTHPGQSQLQSTVDSLRSIFRIGSFCDGPSNWQHAKEGIFNGRLKRHVGEFKKKLAIECRTETRPKNAKNSVTRDHLSVTPAKPLSPKNAQRNEWLPRKQNYWEREKKRVDAWGNGVAVSNQSLPGDN